MSEVSNKTIMTLLVVALAVTVLGTFMSVSKMSALGGTYAAFTGHATDQGTTYITFEGTADILVEDGNVTIPAGYVNPTSATAVVPTDGSTGTFNWLLASDGSDLGAVGLDDYHVIQNNGTTAINVTINADADAETMLCGSSGGCPASTSAKVEVKSVDGNGNSGESGSCTSGTQDSFTELVNYDASTDNTVSLCSYLDSVDTRDTLEVEFRFTIPSDAPQGYHSGTVTYTGEAQ